jgi:hypothetical protein
MHRGRRALRQPGPRRDRRTPRRPLQARRLPLLAPRPRSTHPGRAGPRGRPARRRGELRAGMSVEQLADPELAYPTFTSIVGLAARRIVRELDSSSPRRPAPDPWAPRSGSIASGDRPPSHTPGTWSHRVRMARLPEAGRRVPQGVPSAPMIPAPMGFSEGSPEEMRAFACVTPFVTGPLR